MTTRRITRYIAFIPYFAMCPPPIARKAIERFSKRGDLVFDPFCGAGVTMVEAMLTGRRSIGVDILSIATFISKVKTTLVDFSLRDAQAIADRAWKLAPDIADPKSILPPVFNMDYWFTAEIQRQLAAIVTCIARERKKDRRDFLNVGFSGIIRAASNAGNLEAHLHIKEGKPPANAIKLFRARLMDMATREKHFQEQLPSPTPSVQIHTADSRNLQHLIDNNSVDFIFTSPPYGTGTKYASIYRFQLELLRLPRPIKPLEASKDFAAELTRSLSEMYRVLKPKRKIAILYGTNNHFSSADVADMAAMAGFVFESTILCPVIDESKMVRGDYRRSMANEHLIVMTKPK